MAYDLETDTIYTRVLKLPDDMDYVIAMEGWFWMSLDWMNVHTEWKAEDFIGMAWRAARETENDGKMQNPGNFVAEFIDAFRYGISRRIRVFLAEQEARTPAAATAAT
jgi:hypothetical protein